MKIFLHVCCAPDLTVSYERLIINNFEPTLFFFNPNIYPFDEYKKRKDEVLKLSKIWNLNIIEDIYTPKKFYDNISNNFDSRCSECIRFRLKESAKKAKELNYEFFSTTLLASPRKSHEIINKWGEYFADLYGIKFYYENFRSNNGVKRSAELCRTYNIYRQKYCGCKFSKKEAIDFENKSKENNFDKLINLVGDKEAKKIFKFYKKDLLRIPEDISSIYLYNFGTEIIKILKPVITIIKKDIADDFNLKNGRVKIGNWKGKFLIW